MKQVVLFDTETTGFPKTPIETQPIDVQPRIIQIHATHIEYDYDRLKVLNVLSSYVSGTDSVPTRITEITGIKMENLIGAPTWADIREEFFGMCKLAGAACAHNFKFDARMVQVEEKILGISERPFDGIAQRCSLEKSRQINKNAPSHSLGQLYKHIFGHDMANAHTADGDVNALTKIYLDLIDKGAWA